LPPPLHFDALLAPHRSLGRKGFIILMSVVVAINFVAGLVFMLKGAWPIFGFCGLDVALIWWAFRANYRAARAYETVQLSGNELRVVKVDQHGHAQGWRFQPYWTRLETIEHPDESTELHLWSHGRHLRVAACLAPQQRRLFARDLEAALRILRHAPPEGSAAAT